MHDRDCIAFLQWALPHLRLRWAGFRKVRHQVCKRIDRRCWELGLSDVAAYRAYLTTQAAEWLILASLCRISISRFYRDRAVFDQLAQVVLPALAKSALTRNATELRCWSLGCASGEEPYSLNLIWQLALAARYPSLTCRIIATDADEHLLQRAKVGCYPASSLRDLPPQWRETAFVQRGAKYCLREEHRRGVEFQGQDIDVGQPTGSFYLILCRNLVLTYFEESLQRQMLKQIILQLHPGGALVIGQHEQLPAGVVGLQPWVSQFGIYRTSSQIKSR